MLNESKTKDYVIYNSPYTKLQKKKTSNRKQIHEGLKMGNMGLFAKGHKKTFQGK